MSDPNCEPSTACEQCTKLNPECKTWEHMLADGLPCPYSDSNKEPVATTATRGAPVETGKMDNITREAVKGCYCTHAHPRYVTP